MVATGRASASHPLWHYLVVFGSPLAMWVALETCQWAGRVRSRGDARQRLPRSRQVVVSAAASAGGGVVHAVVCPEHFREAFAFGIFFALVSAAQLTAASLLIVRPTRRIVIGAVIGNLAVLALWAVSRTVGVPIGPDPWRPEAIGSADRLAVILEMLVVGCSGWVIHSDGASVRVAASAVVPR
jgi:hypothetical protein